MLKILHARLQQYVNRELLVVQAGFRKGRGTRDQIANHRVGTWLLLATAASLQQSQALAQVATQQIFAE